MKTFAMAIRLDDAPALTEADIFKMDDGTTEFEALLYLGYCEPPRTGSIELVELDGRGSVMRTIARVFGAGAKSAPAGLAARGQRRGDGVRRVGAGPAFPRAAS